MSGWDVVTNDRFLVPWLTPWATGRVYSFPFGVTVTATAISTATIYSSPFYVPNVTGTTVTSLGIEITTVGASGTIGRAAIYEYAEGGLFGSLVLDGGTFTTDALGHRSAVVNKFLKQGWYIATYCANGGAVRWFNATVPILLRGGSAPLDISIADWVAKAIMTTADITNILNNGFPKTFSPNPQLAFVDSGTNTLRALIGT